MSWTLLVLGHGRWSYLDAALAELDRSVGLGFFDRRVASLDGCGFPPAWDEKWSGWEFTGTAPGDRRGLSANVTRAWMTLGDDEWVFHLEEDFLVHDAPLDKMRKLLQGRPNVAQMVLERQPVNPAEFANGGLLGADNIPTFTSHRRWREQHHLFSFNPFVAHSSALARGGTELAVTKRLRAEGYSFGFWGAHGDAPRCTHIGVSGGMGSPGWMS